MEGMLYVSNTVIRRHIRHPVTQAYIRWTMLQGTYNSKVTESRIAITRNGSHFRNFVTKFWITFAHRLAVWWKSNRHRRAIPRGGYRGGRLALETLGRALNGSDRVLVAAFGTIYVAIQPGGVATESDAYDPTSAKQFGFLAPFVTVDNPSSSILTRERLGWNRSQLGLIANLDR